VKPLCLSCESPADGDFCAACGQATREPRRPLFTLLGSFFSEFLSVDGKHLRTAGQLFAPGLLTQLHLKGKRASYTAPVRVYLVASLLFFVFVGVPAPNADHVNVYIDEILVGRDEPQEGLSDLQLFALDRDTVAGKWSSRASCSGCSM
jgi:hypothetical protein